MARTIKFRGWDDVERLFEYVELLPRGGMLLAEWKRDIGDWQQFTGLHDRHGKEIYEGDIVRQNTYQGQKLEVVEFAYGGFFAVWHSGSSTRRSPKYVNSRIQVVGNLYETPRLLEQRGTAAVSSGSTLGSTSGGTFEEHHKRLGERPRLVMLLRLLILLNWRREWDSNPR
ncbi:MAG: YopX family protein [Vicinamibacterales bacterium]